MTTIEIFEPAGCCATSSTVVDPEALRFNADMDWCKRSNVGIKRHNLTKSPQSFLSNPRVKAFLVLSGSESLPLTLVDGEVALAGRLPNRAELARWAGVELAADVSPAKAASSCCGTGAQQALT